MSAKENIHIEIIDREGARRRVEVPLGVDLNVMEVCKAEDLPVQGTCGGMALCSTCHCYIQSDHDLPEKSDDEEDMLDQAFDVLPNSRLGCQLRITEELDNLIIELAPEGY